MKIIWTGIFVVILGCVFMIRQSGYNPKPILVMKPSLYESNNVVGVSLAKRFYIEAKEKSHFIIYCDLKSCDEDIQIWQSFLNESVKNKLKIRKYYNFLKYKDDNELDSNVMQVMSSITGDDYTLHILPKTMQEKLNINRMPSVVEFFMTNFYLSTSEEEKDKPCKDFKDMANVDCLRLGFSRRHYRKKFDSKDKHIGMEKISNNKYLIYLN